MLFKTSLALAGLMFAVSATADIAVTFDEGAPKDRFTFRNTGDCVIEQATLTLDLTGSRGRLVFDVTGEGKGVEVFQPLEFVSGAGALSGKPEVRDGDTSLDLNIDVLPSGKAIAFTIDVDDTLGGREITVTGAEIEGATVSLTDGVIRRSASIDASARAIVETVACGNT